LARGDRERLAAVVREFHAALAAEGEAGVDLLPFEGAAPALRLAPRASTPPSPAPPPVRPAPSPSGGTPKVRALAAVAAEIAGCRACRLCEGRTQTVPGEGDPDAAILFVGEGPGEQEDLSGRPFVGRAGQLLRRMILEEIGIPPERVFIANLVKCRPPGNRAPAPDEAAACLPFLRRQVAAVRPRILVTLGNPATQSLLQTKEGITRLRGKPVVKGGFTFFPTYHPSYLLRNPPAEPEGREDFRAVRALLDAAAR
jgi:uracil-DNA glycosylase family 4